MKILRDSRIATEDEILKTEISNWFLLLLEWSADLVQIKEIEDGFVYKRNRVDGAFRRDPKSIFLGIIYDDLHHRT